MFALLALLALLFSLLATLSGAHTAPDGACVGHEVTVWRDQPVPCDVRPPQVLTVLGLPNEPACDDLGGTWVYEACVGVDY